ncbi:hypothetical protein [Micromonospora sp. CV4]|uniref:hypothetical protein n=1 Tax=Micromonospora sp. CV4 TaxID=2478711 RepID=UPI000EF538A0|nr:hypothetical protein [Micromonospora sp. CV4]RLP93994.1 hypothetical protein EAD98_17565 [Micromonospora sp. CV4]
MSDVDEREALDLPTILNHATAAHAAHPDGPLPSGGRPYPDPDHVASASSIGASYRDRKRLLVDLVTSVHQAVPSPAAAGKRLTEALASMRVDHRVVVPLLEAVADVDPRWRRQVGRELAYGGRQRGTVSVGLALLTGVAEPHDAGPVRLLGLLSSPFGELAIRVLRDVPGAAGDLVWLAERSDRWRHAQAVAALCALAEPATFDWLLEHGIRLDGRSVTAARLIAETVNIADRVAADDVNEDVVEQVGRVLLAMTQRAAGNAELRAYRDARTAITRFAYAAPVMTATLDRYALIVGLLSDLAIGQAATLSWQRQDLDRVRSGLDQLLAQPAWADVLETAQRSADPKACHRAHWAVWARTTNRPPQPIGLAMGGATSRMSIRVAVADPEYAGAVETRIFIDDRPIVVETFTLGPAEPPEYLLGPAHRLHADVEPHEVRLAEAGCTEGCCGALYVTIQRRGDEVVWRDWRNPDDCDLTVPVFTFDAAQYDAEIARAESDRTWEWHERTVARLVRGRLSDEPELLGRWDCHPGWMEARPNDRGRIHVSYLFRRRQTGGAEPWLQFVAVLDVPAGEPATVADDIVRELCDRDPRRQDRLAGGSREAAEQLGFQWPPHRA